MMKMIKSCNSCIKGVGTYAIRTFATSFFCDICYPLFVTSVTPIFGQLPPPKFIFDFFQIIFRFEYQTIMLEVVMDLVVNEVIDKEVDKEMTKVVEEVNKKLVKEVNEGLVVVCRKSLKVHMVTTY